MLGPRKGSLRVLVSTESQPIKRVRCAPAKEPEMVRAGLEDRATDVHFILEMNS